MRIGENTARLSGGRFGTSKCVALLVARVGVCMSVCVLCGCSGSYCRPVANPLSINEPLANVWQVSQAELKSRGFELDRVDLRSGAIDTFPLVSKQWFEFWRNDVVDGESLAQASLHTIRRQIHLELVQDGDKYNLQCRVCVEKLSGKSSIAGGKAQARQLFAVAANKKQKNMSQQWVAFDDDHVLEQHILHSITKKLGRK
jgi:hypothetical protein